MTLGEDADGVDEVAKLRVFGGVRGIKSLTTPTWSCDETASWEMAALAAYLLGADGVYRAPVEHVYWFLLLSNWRHSKRTGPGAR